jgi:hypothetical protein
VTKKRLTPKRLVTYLRRVFCEGLAAMLWARSEGRILECTFYGHDSVELSKIGSEDERIDSVEAEMCR